jgi:hypothetical protein
MIVAIAAGDAPADGAADEARKHVADCAACSEDLALARESLQQLEAPESGTLPAARSFGGRVAIAAAVLICGIAGATILRIGASRRAAEARVAALEQAVAALQEKLAQTEAARQALTQPLTNPPLLELLPRHLIGRGTSDAGPPATLRPNGPYAVLSLLHEATAQYDDYRLQITNPQGAVAWTVRGLIRQQDGDFTVLLPTAGLEGGRYELRLEGRRREHWNMLGTYSLDVRRDEP